MASVISFRIDDEDRELLQQIADEYDATISWAARRAIKQYLANFTKENANENRNNLLNQSNETTSGIGAHSYCNDAESLEQQI